MDIKNKIESRLNIETAASDSQIIKDCSKAIKANSTLTPIEKKSEVGGGECFIEIDSNRGGNLTEKDLARIKTSLSKYKISGITIQFNDSSNDQIVFTSDAFVGES